MGRHRILILGGTTEARHLAEELVGRQDIDATISLAGRTAEPKPLPLPVRIGGFGGVQGLIDYLANENIAMVIDATHPFADRISANAAEAAAAMAVPLLTLCRGGWERVFADRWTIVADIDSAVAALGVEPKNVFLAIGRQEASRFSVAPQHSYLVRSVDPVDPPLDVPACRYLLASGPFEEADERALLRDNHIDVVVSKNSGGDATYGKIAAARALGIEVVMIERGKPAGTQRVDTVEAALALIDQCLPPA